MEKLRYFISSTEACISLKKVDNDALYKEKVVMRPAKLFVAVPYFDTWEEAHQYLLEEINDDIDKAKREMLTAELELRNAEDRLAKAVQMKNPK